MANTAYVSPTLRWYPWTSQLLISGMMIFTIFQPTEIPAPFPPANQQTWSNIDAICGGGLKRTTCHMQNKTATTHVDRFAIRISHLKQEISHSFLKYRPPLIQLLATVWLTKIRLSSHPFNFWICVRSMLLKTGTHVVGVCILILTGYLTEYPWVVPGWKLGRVTQRIFGSSPKWSKPKYILLFWSLSLARWWQTLDCLLVKYWFIMFDSCVFSKNQTLTNFW